MTRGRRRLQVAAAAVAGLAVAAVAVWVADEPDEAAGPCADRSGLVETTTEVFVPADELLPSGSVGDARRPVVEAVDGLARELGAGRVLGGRFFRTGQVPALVPLDAAVPGTVLLARPPAPDQPGALTAVALPAGAPTWSRTFTGSTPGGGLVGDLLVTVLGPDARADEVRPPAVLTLDPADGTLLSCVAPAIDSDVLGGGDLRMLADQAGVDVVVAAVAPGSAVTLSRLDPATGRTVWGRQTDGVTEVASVNVTGTGPQGVVVLSRIGHDPVGLVELAAAGPDGPTITAYSLADGNSAWTYPPADEADRTAAMVVGADATSGATVVVTAIREPSSQRFPRTRLVVLDPGGGEAWSRPLGRGFWDAELWGSLVVLRGPDPRGGQGATLLRAHDLADGRPRWTVSSRDLQPRGPEPRTGFGAGVALGEEYAVPTPNGLLLVDPDTGATTRLDSEVAVEQLLPVGEWLLVRAADSLLVVGGRP